MPTTRGWVAQTRSWERGWGGAPALASVHRPDGDDSRGGPRGIFPDGAKSARRRREIDKAPLGRQAGRGSPGVSAIAALQEVEPGAVLLPRLHRGAKSLLLARPEAGDPGAPMGTGEEFPVEISHRAETLPPFSAVERDREGRVAGTGHPVKDEERLALCEESVGAAGAAIGIDRPVCRPVHSRIVGKGGTEPHPAVALIEPDQMAPAAGIKGEIQKGMGAARIPIAGRVPPGLPSLAAVRRAGDPHLASAHISAPSTGPDADDLLAEGGDLRVAPPMSRNGWDVRRDVDRRGKAPAPVPRRAVEKPRRFAGCFLFEQEVQNALGPIDVHRRRPHDFRLATVRASVWRGALRQSGKKRARDQAPSDRGDHHQLRWKPP